MERRGAHIKANCNLQCIEEVTDLVMRETSKVRAIRIYQLPVYPYSHGIFNVASSPFALSWACVFITGSTVLRTSSHFGWNMYLKIVWNLNVRFWQDSRVFHWVRLMPRICSCGVSMRWRYQVLYWCPRWTNRMTGIVFNVDAADDFEPLQANYNESGSMYRQIVWTVWWKLTDLQLDTLSKTGLFFLKIFF